jgi:hypothetical protein
MRYIATLRGSWPELKAKLKVTFPGLATDDIEEGEGAKAIVLDRLRNQFKKTTQELTRILNRS